jgi:hypothetical protein
VPLVVIPWWLLVIIGGFKTWATLQKRLAKPTRRPAVIPP